MHLAAQVQQLERQEAWLDVMREWHSQIEYELQQKAADRFYRKDFETFLEANPQLNAPDKVTLDS